MKKCNLCGTDMDTGDPLRENLGGDCLTCMAEAGDPHAQARFQEITMKTLREQQTEAWRLAPDDALAVSQNSNGHWKSLQIVQLDYSYLAEYIDLFQSEINGWDWRDTLQSRKEFEEMKTKIDFTEFDKEDFVPEVGQSVQCKDSPDISGTVLFVGKKHALLEGDDGEEWAIYIDSLEPVKSEAENARDKQIESLASYMSSLKTHHLTPHNNFVFKRIEHLESQTMRMSYNDGPAKGTIRDLYRVVDVDDGAKALAKSLYNAGCRMTRELTDDVIERIFDDLPDGAGPMRLRFARAIAAYVTGSGEYE